MRKLFHLVLSCLVLGAVLAPVASAHNENHDNGRGERSHEGNPDRGHGRGKGSHPGKGNGRHKSPRHGDEKDRSRGQASFFGAPGQASCSQDPWACEFTFSRSVTGKLFERLNWVLTNHIEYAQKFASRICRRAERTNECAGSFVAGLWNGVDELTLAVAENACATVRLVWSKSDGLSQTWGRTTDPCQD